MLKTPEEHVEMGLWDLEVAGKRLSILPSCNIIARKFAPPVAFMLIFWQISQILGMSTFPGYLDAMLQTRYIKEVYPAVKHIIIYFYEVSFDMSSHNSFLKPVYEPHQRRRIGLKFILT